MFIKIELILIDALKIIFLPTFENYHIEITRMNMFKHKITVYLPILFAVVLSAGILIGVKLTPHSNTQDNIFPINLSGYDKIGDIVNYIRQDYVDTVNLENIKENAINHILSELDPHSQYIPAREFNEVNEQLEGNFEGIGVQFRIEKDTVMVISPVAGGPSEKVGIKAGDRIVIVDGDTIGDIIGTCRAVIDVVG